MCLIEVIAAQCLHKAVYRADGEIRLYSLCVPTSRGWTNVSRQSVGDVGSGSSVVLYMEDDNRTFRLSL